MKGGYLALCLMCKDENQYLEEWLDYHFALGIQHVYIYDNLSSIPLTTTVASYIKGGRVTVINWPYDNIQGRHTRSQNDCIQRFGKKWFWIGFIDTDEFIVLKNGQTDLKKFLKSYESYGGLGINWLVFGSNGHMKTQESVIESYTQCVPGKKIDNVHIKTIINTQYFDERVKRRDPHFFPTFSNRPIVNSHKKKITSPRSKPIVWDHIQLNHYVVRSYEEYQLKNKRGGGNSTLKHRSRRGDAFFNSFNVGDDHDFSIIELYKKIKKNEVKR